jgi:hypothetical protein
MDVYTLAISIFIGTHYLLVGDEERLGGVNSALNNAARDASAGGRKLFARTVELTTRARALFRVTACASPLLGGRGRPMKSGAASRLQ